MTNYEFWWDGQPYGMDDLFIGTVFMDEWTRPQVGLQITIKGKLLKVTRADPAGNPTGQKVKYFVESLNPDWPYKQKKE